MLMLRMPNGDWIFEDQRRQAYLNLARLDGYKDEGMHLDIGY